MSENENHEDKGFKVTDHRGEEKAATDKEEPSIDEKESDPKVSFVSFVLSLSTSAMVHLGLTENPVSKKKEEDINLAHQEIHIIEMLKEKTAGNLSSEEARLLDEILFHLRMKYVDKVKG